MTESSAYSFVRELTRLDELLGRSARLTPGAVLLRLPGATVSYAEVEAEVEEFSQLLTGLGLLDGDRVAILAENGVGYVRAFFGSMRAGAIAVPVNTAVDAAGLSHLLSDSGARALVFTKRFAPVVEACLSGEGAPAGVEWALGEAQVALGSVRYLAWEPGTQSPGSVPGVVAAGGARGTSSAKPRASSTRGPDDPAAIIYTSGSTGAPRGATLTHRNLLTNTWSILEYLRLDAEARMMVVLPFYYVYGMSLLNTHLAVGASLIVGTELFFPNKVVDRMHTERATGFAGVPSSFNVLLHRSRLKDDVPASLKYVTQAGGAMAPELTRELVKALPGVAIFVMYGATEASARLSYLPPDRLEEKVGSIGVAIPGVTLRVLREDGTEAETDEPGELVASGDNIMSGYWNAPEETAEVLGPEGLRTGDLARRDADGFFYIVGRKKEMIKSGAHRISPKEIEERLVEHPAVLEAAVIGIPDDLLGEAILAFVVLHGSEGGRSDEADPDERALQRFLLDRIAEYKVPRRIVFTDSLPKNESGKVRKQELRAGLDPAPTKSPD